MQICNFTHGTWPLQDCCESSLDFLQYHREVPLFCCSLNRKTNIFDNIVYMMEKYADNLEELVMERTGQLIEEKKKTDALLERMLPR